MGFYRNPRQWFLLVALIIAVLIAALPVLTYPMGRDQGMYANVGQAINQGGIPFVDMWDIKPPPIYYIYAAGIRLFGTSTWSIRLIDFTLIPFGMLGLFLMGWQLRDETVGTMAALLYGIFYFNEDFQNLTQSDSLVTVLLIWAAYTTYRNMSGASWRWAFSAGVLSGFIVWFKPYYLFFVLALVLSRIAAYVKSRTTRRQFLQDSIAFVLGGLLTGGVLLFYFWQQGILNEMWIVAEGTAAYNAQERDFGAFIANMRHYWTFRWQTWHVLLILAAMWFALRILIASKVLSLPESEDDQPETPGWWLVLSWLVAALAFALIQAKGFDTHWIPMLPAMALLAGDTISIIVGGQSRRLRIPVLVLLAVGCLLILANTTWGRSWRYILGQETRVAHFDRFQANDLKPEESLLVSQYLRERVSPGDSLYIWGFRPEVYFMAQLNPATRYQAHFPLVALWYPHDWQQDNVDLLWAAMPPYVLILEDDYMPWVTDSPDDSHTILQGYTELNNWLIANYERVDEIGDFLIWKRQTP